MTVPMWVLDAIVEVDEHGKVTEYAPDCSPCREMDQFVRSDRWHRMSRREREVYFAPSDVEDAA